MPHARGKRRLGNTPIEKAPLHGGHSPFSYLPLPPLQSGLAGPFGGEAKGRAGKKQGPCCRNGKASVDPRPSCGEDVERFSQAGLVPVRFQMGIEPLLFRPAKGAILVFVLELG